MRIFLHDGLDPGENLALEEVLLETSSRDGCCWVWRNAPAVILGRHQILRNEVDVPFARTNGISAYRRKTGGGAVYHDLGVVNFTFVVPAVCPVSDCLAAVLDGLGFPVVVTERNDVLQNGRKIIGTAQRLRGVRRLFHGSLLYEADLANLAAVLVPSAGKLARHGVASVRARVANFGPVAGWSADRFRLELTDRLSARFGRVAEPLPESVRSVARRRRRRPLPYGEEADPND